MAANLLRAGFPLTVFNRSPQRLPPLIAAGATAAASPAAAARGAEVLCLCLSDDRAVREALLGAPADPADASDAFHASGTPPRRTQAAIAALSPGSLVIDFSTIAPATARDLAAWLGRGGVAYLDAPVTGGTEGARAATLSVLVGGSPDDVARARPVLEAVGSRITHLGPVGAGQQAKAVNQVLVAGTTAAVAEALALGRRLGLPMPAVVEALRSGAAGSWALEHRAAGMLAGTFPLGFRLTLHRKDLAIALAAAADVDLALPVCERVAAMEDALIEAGCGEEDVSALARFFSLPPARPADGSARIEG
jgi:3-hydroxyisobutyrate dehydrogenase-like beta-hydroxyacid dehydrogenase